MVEINQGLSALSVQSNSLNGQFVLGIESSCDDAGASVLKVPEGDVLSNIISSQVKTHSPYGGVVPELASRQHFKNIPAVVDMALEQAGIKFNDVALICATSSPGLVGSLLVGLSYAKALAFSKKLPFLGVHHIEAHMMAVHLENKVNYPYVALVVSGGHTHLFLVRDFGKYELLGGTVDDAAGEAFDKVAKFFSLGFPGGPFVDKLSQKGNPKTYLFPRSFMEENNFKFSFSGLKTAVIQHAKKYPESKLEDILASFQEAIVDVLVAKTKRAALKYECQNVVMCGGVACNSRLREAMKEICQQFNLKFYAPTPILCTDNAAMVAYTGWQSWMHGRTSSDTLRSECDN